VVVGIGASSRGPLAHRTALAFAERLDMAAVEFPGGHVGSIQEPLEFGDMLRKGLTT
jgi:hypothetical protein